MASKHSERALLKTVHLTKVHIALTGSVNGEPGYITESTIKCDSSDVYASAACHDHRMRCRSTSESALAAQSGVCAKSRKSIRKRRRSDAVYIGRITAASSVASGTF